MENIFSSGVSCSFPLPISKYIVTCLLIFLRDYDRLNGLILAKSLNPFLSVITLQG